MGNTTPFSALWPVLLNTFINRKLRAKSPGLKRYLSQLGATMYRLHDGREHKWASGATNNIFFRVPFNNTRFAYCAQSARRIEARGAPSTKYYETYERKHSTPRISTRKSHLLAGKHSDQILHNIFFVGYKYPGQIFRSSK